MKWTKENMAKAIKKAKSKMDKFTANNYANWISGKTKEYPTTHFIYEIFGNWTKMKKYVFGDSVEYYNRNKYNGTEEEAIKMLRMLIPQVDRVSLSQIKEKAEGGFPSRSYIREHFGGFTNMKNIAAETDIKTYNYKPQECLDCGIGRCRFDNNLDECEYYEGE